MTRLVISRRAAADLEEIGDYIARDNPERALSFVSELKDHCQQITRMPLGYPKRADIGPGIRMAVHGRYHILFRAERDVVRIERVIHGARRVRRLT